MSIDKKGSSKKKIAVAKIFDCDGLLAAALVGWLASKIATAALTETVFLLRHWWG